MSDRFPGRHDSPSPSPEGDCTDDGRFWFDHGNTPWRPCRPRRGLHGSARLARRQDLADLLAAHGPRQRPGERSELPFYAALLEASADGGTLEPLVYQSLHLPDELRARHMLAVGQTGCGKTTRFIYPLIASDMARRPRTVIAFDAKGKKLLPLMEHLAARYRPGEKVHLLNFCDPQRSGRWSAIQGIKTHGEAHKIAYTLCTLVDRGGEREGAFWLNNSIDTLSGILLALATDPKEDASIGRALQIAHMSFSELAKFAKAHPQAGVLQRVVELYGDAHTTGACVMQDLRMRLSLFSDERVCATTSGVGPNQFDLDSLLLKGGSLVIEVSETDVARLRQVVNLFMNHLFGRLIHLAEHSTAGRLPVPCSLFLDEFASAVGRIDEMEVRLNTLRERGVSIVAAVQSLSQLGIYGASATQVLAGFASKVFFAGLDLSDAEYASRLGGVTTVYNAPDEEESGQVMSGPSPQVPRQLLLPEEVARPVNHPTFGPPATLFLADRPALQIYLRPAYDLPVLARFLSPDEPAAVAPAKEIEQGREQMLGLDAAGEPSRQWWREQSEGWSDDRRQQVMERLEELLELWGRLNNPAPFLDGLHQASQQSGARQFDAWVTFYQYRLQCQEEEEKLGPPAPPAQAGRGEG